MRTQAGKDIRLDKNWEDFAVGRIAVRLSVLLGILSISLGNAHAQSPDAFYRGKNVALVIGYSVGGGYDTYARLLARHLGRHVPGNPSIVPQNMPGAGSQKSLEYILNHAPKDGLTIGTFSRSLAVAPLIDKAKYDPRRLEWVGSISTDSTVCVAWHQSGIKTWDDMKTKQFTVGGLGRGSDPEIYAILMREMFKLNVKLVSGYPGSNDVILAMERGEVDGNCGWSWTTAKQNRPQWFKDGTVNIIMQMALSKHPELPNVPLVTEIARNDAERSQIELVMSRQTMGRPFFAPPDVPAARVAALRRAFMAAMKDPEFLAQAQRMKLETNAVSGEEVQALVTKLLNAPADVVAMTRRNLSASN